LQVEGDGNNTTNQRTQTPTDPNLPPPGESFRLQAEAWEKERDELKAEIEKLKRQLELSESRRKILELEMDKPRWEEARRQREEREYAEAEEQRRQKDLAESCRKLQEMRAEEEERRQAAEQARQEKLKRAAEENARKEKEEQDRVREKWEEARQQREAQEKREHAEAEERQRQKDLAESRRKLQEMRAKEEERRQAAEKARQEALKRAVESREKARKRVEHLRATLRERSRCKARDERLWGKGLWTNVRALERFQVLSEEFVKIQFSESQPLTFEVVPWPVLDNPIRNDSGINFQWNDVEAFFAYAMQVMVPTQYRLLVEETHRMFHPDKWRSRGLLNTVLDEELRTSVETLGNIVAQAITPLWRKCRGYEH
jgi:hypothetical protein